jgi:hypothetical protein
MTIVEIKQINASLKEKHANNQISEKSAPPEPEKKDPQHRL